MGQVKRSEPVDRDRRWLYRVGGVGILVAVVLFRRNFGAEVMVFRGFGILRDVPAEWPVTALEWFTLLQDNRFVGLFLLELKDIVNYALVGLFFLALFGTLRQAHGGAATVALASGLVGVGIYLASNQAFALLNLSDRYAVATSDTQRSAFLAAGEGLLAVHNPGTIHQGTGIHASLFLVLVAGLVFSIAMLQSGLFGKAAAYCGIVANGLALCGFVALALGGLAPPAFETALHAIPPAGSAPFRLAWYVLTAIGLFRLASSRSGAEATHTGGSQ